MKPLKTFKQDGYNYVIHRDTVGFYFNRSTDPIDDMAKIYGIESLKYYIRFRFDYHGLRNFPGYKEATCSTGVYLIETNLVTVINIDKIDDCELDLELVKLRVIIGGASTPENVEIEIPLKGKQYSLHKNLILIY